MIAELGLYPSSTKDRVTMGLFPDTTPYIIPIVDGRLQSVKLPNGATYYPPKLTTDAKRRGELYGLRYSGDPAAMASGRGFVVHTSTQAELQAVAKGTRVEGRTYHGLCHEREGKTHIYLLNTLPEAERKRVLAHEIAHATDWAYSEQDCDAFAAAFLNSSTQRAPVQTDVSKGARDLGVAWNSGYSLGQTYRGDPWWWAKAEGYRVMSVSQQEMVAIKGRSPGPGKYLMGLCSTQTKEIWLDKGLSRRDQLHTLCHEMSHAEGEGLDWSEATCDHFADAFLCHNQEYRKGAA